MNGLRTMRTLLAAIVLVAASCSAAAGEFFLRSRMSGRLHGPFEAVNGTTIQLEKGSYKLLLGPDRFHLQETRGKRRYGPCMYEPGGFLVIGKQGYEVILEHEKEFVYRPPRYPKALPLLKNYLKRPDSRIEVGLGAVILAQQANPKFDADAYLQHLDMMAAELGERLVGIEAGRHIATIMANYLYGDRGLRKRETPYHLPGILKGGKDACVMYSFVYLAMAERLQLPLHAVTVPQHVFVRYETPTERINIETTRDGVIASDTDYVMKQNIARGCITDGVYLRSFSRREFIGILVHNRAVHAAKEDRLDAALRDLELAAYILPRDPEVLFNRARVFEQQGDTGRAFEDYNRALKWNPNHVQSLLFRARLHSGRGEQVRAFRDCYKAVKLAPNNLAARCARGSAYLMLGNLPKAEMDFEAAKKLDSKCAAAWFGLGSLYRRQGITDRALHHLNRALALDPALGEAWASRALTRAAQGDSENALADLGKAIALKPNDPKLYYARGVLHGSRLNRRAMLADLRQAIRLEPATKDLIRRNKGFQRDWGDDAEFRKLADGGR